MVWLMVVLSGLSWALTPPEGWSVQAPDQVVRDPSNRERGILIAIDADGPDTASLSLAMLERSLHTRQVTTESSAVEPTLNLVLTDGRLGRARWNATGKQWIVLLIGEAYASAIDPDAILTSAMKASPPTADAPSVMPGGSDGSPWGSAVSESPAGVGWVSAASVDGWRRDAALVGVWSGNILEGDTPVQIQVTFLADGTVQIERTRQGETTQTRAGRWATQGGTLRLEISGQSTSAEAYQAMGEMLSMRYARTQLTLSRQQAASP